MEDFSQNRTEKLELIKCFVHDLLKECDLQSFYSEAKVESLFLTDETFPHGNSYKVALAIFDLLLMAKEPVYYEEFAF